MKKKYLITLEVEEIIEDTPILPVDPLPEPSPEPPTIAEREPEEYFVLSRVEDMRTELTTLLQENAWAGARDPEYVYTNCPDVADKFFGMSNDDLLAFANEGVELDKEGTGYHMRLPVVNSRCATDSRFCGRSQVRKDRYQEFKARLLAHLTKARELRDNLAGQPGFGEHYNSIKGYCEYVNKNP